MTKAQATGSRRPGSLARRVRGYGGQQKAEATAAQEGRDRGAAEGEADARQKAEAEAATAKLRPTPRPNEGRAEAAAVEKKVAKRRKAPAIVDRPIVSASRWRSPLGFDTVAATARSDHAARDDRQLAEGAQPPPTGFLPPQQQTLLREAAAAVSKYTTAEESRRRRESEEERKRPMRQRPRPRRKPRQRRCGAGRDIGDSAYDGPMAASTRRGAAAVDDDPRAMAAAWQLSQPAGGDGQVSSPSRRRRRHRSGERLRCEMNRLPISAHGRAPMDSSVASAKGGTAGRRADPRRRGPAGGANRCRLRPTRRPVGASCRFGLRWDLGGVTRVQSVPTNNDPGVNGAAVYPHQSRCGEGPISITISPAGEISGGGGSFDSGCAKVPITVRGRAVNGQLQLNISGPGIQNTAALTLGAAAPSLTTAEPTPEAPTFDGTYAGTLTQSGGTQFGKIYALELRVAGRQVTGQAVIQSCGSFPATLSISPTGEISGSVRIAEGPSFLRPSEIRSAAVSPRRGRTSPTGSTALASPPALSIPTAAPPPLRVPPVSSDPADVRIVFTGMERAVFGRPASRRCPNRRIGWAPAGVHLAGSAPT